VARRNKRASTLTVIRALRLANGWTLKEMTYKGFASRFSYCHFESGRRRVSRQKQIFIGNVFAIRPTYLFDRYGYPVRLSRQDILSLTIAKRRRGDFI